MAKEGLNIVVIDDEPITRMDLKEILESKGCNVLGEAGDGFDAIELCRKNNPDLVLLDVKMPFLDGISAAKIISDEGLADTIVLLTAYNEKEFIEGAKKSGVGGYLVKPIDEKSLMPCIELAVARSREMKKLKKDYEEVTSRLESRKTVEKAKGIIMKQNNLSEQDAYDYIRNISKKKEISMKRVAEIILIKAGE
jgi:two-component system, response regulator PdtaR